MTIRLTVENAGKQYRRGWALQDCTFAVEPGSITALVGPNGAGKTTVMAATAGLIRLTQGEIRVGGRPVDGRIDPHVGYLAQDKPLYRRFTVRDMVAQARDLNASWDSTLADRLVGEAGLSLRARIQTLSGGQRTRLALALVLARRPGLLLLDEPLADLDPLARLEVQQTLMTQAADTGMTILMSSHILGEVRDSCDSLLLMQGGSITLAGALDDLLGDHQFLVGPAPADLDWLPERSRVEVRLAPRQTTVLVSSAPEVLPPGWSQEPASLDDIVIARLRTSAATTEVA